jgi:energy-coupling factor transporter ATP-binding protein EcfA2
MKMHFSAAVRLRERDHLVVLGMGVSAIYILWRFRVLTLAMPVAAFVALYALLWPTQRVLERGAVKGGVYQDAIAKYEKRYSSTGGVMEEHPRMMPIYKKAVDFKGYITSRNNRNMFISGRSGSGKSTLMCHLIGIFESSNRIIFSFKANDDYLKLGIPILRVSDFAANPFSDKEAFVNAFMVTYPMTSQGIIAASVPNLLRITAKLCGSWADFREAIQSARESSKGDTISSSAYLFIEQKIPELEMPPVDYDMDVSSSIVLDFSGLNEAAKSFYAELYLRQAWRSIEQAKEDPMRYVVIIDEAHRLLKSEATVFGEVARLIRSRGALWCGTQNYSDLPDYVRNQFAMQLLFSTKSERDLRAIKEINPLLPFVGAELREHHFTDAASGNLEDAIPIYTTDVKQLGSSAEEFLKPEGRPAAQEERKMPRRDYSRKVMALLEGQASWPKEIARIIQKEEGIELNEAKILAARTLRKLRKEGRIDKVKMKLGEKDVVLYYMRDPSMSGLHRFMEDRMKRQLEVGGIAYELAEPGEDRPDITTKDFDIEIETGLKSNIRPLSERFRRERMTYIVVPNKEVKERYARFASMPQVKVIEIGEALA